MLGTGIPGILSKTTDVGMGVNLISLCVLKLCVRVVVSASLSTLQFAMCSITCVPLRAFSAIANPRWNQQMKQTNTEQEGYGPIDLH